MPPVPSHEDQQAEAGLQKIGFWRRRVIGPIQGQLTQGATPKALSYAVAGGFLCGIFPILGTTTLITTLSAIFFRLNQPVMQSLNWVTYPLHLLLIPAFIRMGEFLFGADPITFSLPQMVDIFAESPSHFFSRFAMTFAHCIVAWVVVVPFLGALIVIAVRPLLKRAADRWMPAPPSSPAP